MKLLQSAVVTVSTDEIEATYMCRNTETMETKFLKVLKLAHDVLNTLNERGDDAGIYLVPLKPIDESVCAISSITRLPA